MFTLYWHISEACPLRRWKYRMSNMFDNVTAMSSLPKAIFLPSLPPSACSLKLVSSPFQSEHTRWFGLKGQLQQICTCSLLLMPKSHGSKGSTNSPQGRFPCSHPRLLTASSPSPNLNGAFSQARTEYSKAGCFSTAFIQSSSCFNSSSHPAWDSCRAICWQRDLKKRP